MTSRRILLALSIYNLLYLHIIISQSVRCSNLVRNPKLPPLEKEIGLSGFSMKLFRYFENNLSVSLNLRSDVRPDAPETLSGVIIGFAYFNPQRGCPVRRFNRNCCDNDGRAEDHAWMNFMMKSGRRSYVSFYTSPT